VEEEQISTMVTTKMLTVIQAAITTCSSSPIIATKSSNSRTFCVSAFRADSPKKDDQIMRDPSCNPQGREFASSSHCRCSDWDKLNGAKNITTASSLVEVHVDALELQIRIATAGSRGIKPCKRRFQ
jgi:hypothetical protein